jgi:hypothetical protein
VLPSADDIVRKLFGPATEVIGEQLGEFVRTRFNDKDKSNLQAHVGAVEDATGSFEPEDLSSQQRRKVIDWAENASNVDPKKDRIESAAWQAALDEIINKNDFQMLDLVKQLNKDEIGLLLDISNDEPVDRSSIQRLINLGLVTSRYKRFPEVVYREVVRIALPLVAVILSFSLMSDLLQILYPGILESDLRRYHPFYVILSNRSFIFTTIALFLIFWTVVQMPRIRRWVAPCVTLYGKKVAAKISKHMRAPPPAVGSS